MYDSWKKVFHPKFHKWTPILGFMLVITFVLLVPVDATNVKVVWIIYFILLVIMLVLFIVSYQYHKRLERKYEEWDNSIIIASFEQYVELANRTLPDKGHNYINELHMLAGIKGEIGELVDAYKKIVIYKKKPDYANIIEEYGDIAWYIAGWITMFEQNFDFSNDYLSLEYPNDNEKSKYYSDSEILSDLVEIDQVKLANDDISALVYWWLDLGDKMLINKKEALAHNIKKLILRYPEGYSDQFAQKRMDKN